MGIRRKTTASLRECHPQTYSCPNPGTLRTKKAVTIETDASKYATAGIISQIGDDGFLRPIAFRSKSRSKSECNYDVHDKELLAIILALEDWRRYVKGSRQRAKILTDHKNLVPFMTKKKLNERQVR